MSRRSQSTKNRILMIRVDTGNSGPESLSLAANDKPHAYDPAAQPEYFETVLRRRMMAFVIDAIIIVSLTAALYVVVFLLGIVTLGLAWLLLGLVFPVVALSYSAFTLGQPQSATVGMRVFELEMRTWYGAPCYALLGAFHALLFWITVAVFTPIILLLALFNGRKRTLHDFLAGTVVVNAESMARALRG